MVFHELQAATVTASTALSTTIERRIELPHPIPPTLGCRSGAEAPVRVPLRSNAEPIEQLPGAGAERAGPGWLVGRVRLAPGIVVSLARWNAPEQRCDQPNKTAPDFVKTSQGQWDWVDLVE